MKFFPFVSQEMPNFAVQKASVNALLCAYTANLNQEVIHTYQFRRKWLTQRKSRRLLFRYSTKMD